MGGQLCRIRTTTVVRDMDFALAGKDTLMYLLSRPPGSNLINLLNNCYGGSYVHSATSTL